MATPLRAHVPTPNLNLDELARLGFDELEALYRRGTVPASLRTLDGRPACRMLALKGPLGRGFPYALVRAWSASDAFVWNGKVFSSIDDSRGRGINRINLRPELELYRFDTYIEPSALDGRPCVRLDYDRDDNPWLIRRIRDELREVAPGLWLGPAMADVAAPFTVLWFACQYG